MLFYVGIMQISKVWPIVEPMLAIAAERSDGDFTTDVVYQNLIFGHMQLFVWQVNEKISAACVTEIYSRRCKKVCSMPLIGGTDMKFWLKAEDELVKYAKEQGCSQLEGYCRDGWLRVLKNWKKVWVTMRRDI